MVASNRSFDDMRERWKEVLTGGEFLDPSDPDIALKLRNVEEKARHYWGSMLKTDGRTCLWSDLSNELKAKNSFESCVRLEAMTAALCTRGSKLRHDLALLEDILRALEWIHDHSYNPQEPIEQEWFFKMGMPMSLNNMTVMLYDKLPAAALKRYMEAVACFSRDTSYCGVSTACNRIWRCLVIVVHGIITRDPARISFGMEQLAEPSGRVFDMVEEGDGYYRDGSFIQHDIYAYNGGYGKDSIHALAYLLYLVHGSQWEAGKRHTDILFNLIRNSYEPLLFKGQMMDMTRGREVARPHCTAHTAGHFIMEGILVAAQMAGSEDALALRGMLKHWIEAGTRIPFYRNATVYAVHTAKSLLQHSSIQGGGTALHKQYTAMDKVVHRRGGYSFGVSMFSSRTGNFESINYENLKGWHTSDGMTFLYNDDQLQFDDHYWVTVDSKRLPGITVDSGTFIGASPLRWTASRKKEYLNPADWTGGTSTDHLHGVCGMAIEAEGCTLSAKKSWMMFDREILCLGSGITSTDGRDIETVVENRKLNPGKRGSLTLDGLSRPLDTHLRMEQSVRWTHLDAGLPGADVGYCFPGGQRVSVIFEVRHGNWAEINKWYGDETDHCREYLTLLCKHGANPIDAGYAYVLLPGASVRETADYAARPDVEILAQSAQVHAARHRGLNITMANFWEDMTASAGGITCNRKASIMLVRTGEALELSVADPTHRNEGAIHIELDLGAAVILRADPRMKVVSLYPKICLQVEMKNTRGRSVKASFSLRGSELRG